MVQEINDFLSEKDCEKLIQLASSTFEGVDVLGESIEGYRVAQGAWLEDEDDEIVLRYRNMISEQTDLPIINMEQIHIVKYAIGEEYKEHHDFFHPGEYYYDSEIERGGQRLKTALIYLNDDFEGGETHFPSLNLVVKPKKGKLVIWDNVNEDGSLDFNSLHAGLPVKKGFKYIAVIWIRENKFY